MSDSRTPYEITRAGRSIRTHIPYTWHCEVTISASLVIGNSRTKPCGATGRTRSEQDAHVGARAHIAEAHPQVELPHRKEK